MRILEYLADKATKLYSIVPAIKKSRLVPKALIPVALISILAGAPQKKAYAQNPEPTRIEMVLGSHFSHAYEPEPFGVDWPIPGESLQTPTKISLGVGSLGALSQYSKRTPLYEKAFVGKPLLTGALETKGFSFASGNMGVGYEEIEKRGRDGYSDLEAAVLERKAEMDKLAGIKNPAQDMFGAGKLTTRKYWTDTGGFKFSLLDDVSGGAKYYGFSFRDAVAFQQNTELDTLALKLSGFQGNWRQGVLSRDAQNKPVTGREFGLAFNQGTNHALSFSERDVGAVLDRSLTYGKELAIGYSRGLLRGPSPGTLFKLTTGDSALGFYSDDLDVTEVTFASPKTQLMHRSQPDMRTLLYKNRGSSYTLNLHDDYTRAYFEKPGALSRLGIGTDLLLLGYALDNFKLYYSSEGDNPDIISLSTGFASYNRALNKGIEQRIITIPRFGLEAISDSKGDLFKYQKGDVIASAYLGEDDSTYLFRLKDSPFQFGYSKLNGPQILYGTSKVSAGYCNGDLTAALGWKPMRWFAVELAAPQSDKPQMALFSLNFSDYLRVQLRGEAAGLKEFHPLGAVYELSLGRRFKAAMIYERDKPVIRRATYLLDERAEDPIRYISADFNQEGDDFLLGISAALQF